MPKILTAAQLEQARRDFQAFLDYYLAVTTATGGTCQQCPTQADRLTTGPRQVCGRCLFHWWRRGHPTPIVDVIPERGRLYFDGNFDARTRAQFKQLLAATAADTFLARAAAAVRQWKDGNEATAGHDEEPEQADIAAAMGVSVETLRRRGRKAGHAWKTFVQQALSGAI